MIVVSRFTAAIVVAFLAGSPGAFAQAQPAPATTQRGDAAGPQRNAAPQPQRPPSAEVTGRVLPPDVTTSHRLEIAGRTLAFRATAGALTLTDPSGHVQAELAFVAYTLDAADPARRPVTFAVNGGPGAASAYLHLGPLGPWRLPVGQETISASQAVGLVPNAETWLDFTDLVFIDPVETGYSRASGPREEIRDRYFTVDGDVGALSAAIARWLRQNDRMASPKFFIGESYGGFRGPLVARKLATDTGIGLSGMVLLSPVLDFSAISRPRTSPETFVANLPSVVAAGRERTGAVARADLAEAERYASGEYLVDLTRGVRDVQAVERVGRRVAELSGLDPAFVRRAEGRIDAGALTRELRRPDGKVTSLYDTGVAGFDPDPGSPRSEADEPGLTALKAPLTSAMVDHLARTLGWRVPNARYELLNNAVAGGWRFGRGRRAPEVVGDLRDALAFDARLRVMVAHGLTDLVTPYFASELALRQVPDYGGAGRLTLQTYPGGHMFYTRDASRAAFRADAVRMYDAALAARAGE